MGVGRQGEGRTDEARGWVAVHLGAWCQGEEAGPNRPNWRLGRQSIPSTEEEVRTDEAHGWVAVEALVAVGPKSRAGPRIEPKGRAGPDGRTAGWAVETTLIGSLWKPVSKALEGLAGLEAGLEADLEGTRVSGERPPRAPPGPPLGGSRCHSRHRPMRRARLAGGRCGVAEQAALVRGGCLVL